MHLILPHAASQQWPASALSGLHLPHLQRLLAQLFPQAPEYEDGDEAGHPLTPAEQLQVRAQGWPKDGPWPFAAAASGQAGAQASAQAWITPCHWQVGMDTVLMHHPTGLALSEDESRALMDSVQPWMAEDGLQLRWHDALHWHASGPLLASPTPASLERVSGGNIRPWLMQSHLPAALLRLQSEMQMLLYHHPVNEAREARGLPTVNSFWLHGAGNPQPSRSGVQAPADLSLAVHRGDLAAWRAAWQRLDAELLAPLSEGPVADVQLSLCSESAAQTWTGRPLSWRSRLQRLWQRPEPEQVLKTLLTPTP